MGGSDPRPHPAPINTSMTEDVMDKKRIIEMTEEEQALDWVKDLVKEIDDTGSPLAVSRLNIEITRMRNRLNGDVKEKTESIIAEASGDHCPTAPKEYVESKKRCDDFLKANSRLSRYKTQIPNLAGQSEIFKPVTKGRRKYFKNYHKIQILGRDDLQIEMQGYQLDQHDLTGWLAMIKLTGSDFVSRFTQYEFLNLLKKDTGGKGYRWLTGEYNKEKTEQLKTGFLDRISGTKFKVSLIHQNKTWMRYTGSLALEGVEEGSEGNPSRFAYNLSKPLATLFGFDGWSYTDLEQRIALGQKQNAQAFHAFLSTHTCPSKGLWWKKEDLMKSWGAEDNTGVLIHEFMKEFRRTVIKPLVQIKFITRVDEKASAVGFWW